MDAVTIDEKIKSVEEILIELEKDDIAIEDLKINPDGTTSSFDDADF